MSENPATDLSDSIPSETQNVPALVPARMLNEFTYGPRLAYLMWTQSEWADNADNLDMFTAASMPLRAGGRALHERSVRL